jgi:hypothetical protein
MEDARFRVDALDGAARPGPDAYALTVYTPTGRLYHQVGTPTAPLRLASGRVVVQP